MSLNWVSYRVHSRQHRTIRISLCTALPPMAKCARVAPKVIACHGCSRSVHNTLSAWAQAVHVSMQNFKCLDCRSPTLTGLLSLVGIPYGILSLYSRYIYHWRRRTDIAIYSTIRLVALLSLARTVGWCEVLSSGWG